MKVFVLTYLILVLGLTAKKESIKEPQSKKLIKSEICRALALEGGGDKGSWEAGVIKGLVDHLPPEEV
jgi:predicted acylesterase/phospholipase RssA